MPDSRNGVRSPSPEEGRFSEAAGLPRWAANPLVRRLTQSPWFHKLPPWAWGALALGALFGALWLLKGILSPAPSAIQEPPGSNPTALAVDILIKLSLVVGLIYGGMWVFRRWRGAEIRSGLKKVEVLETVHLSPRRALHLIRAGEHTLLIGATDQQVNFLSNIEVEPPGLDGDVAPAFARLLAEQTQGDPSPANGAAVKSAARSHSGLADRQSGKISDPAMESGYPDEDQE